MIVLDTNVLSAIMLPTPDRLVLEWLDAQPDTSVWTTAVNIFEIRLGLEIMAPGRRRTILEGAFDRILEGIIEGRVLPLDAAAAEAAAILSGRRRQDGRVHELRDTMIAGIAIARRATLATRNTRHFADLSVPVVDPWAT